MKSRMMFCCLFFIFPAMLGAEDQRIEINTTPRGIADEVIKIDDHQQRMMDVERERIKAERAEESRKLSEVGRAYLANGEIDMAIDFYDKAIAADETNTDAHAGKMNALTVRDEEERKIGANYHQAMEFFRKGLRRQAADALVAEIKANPENQMARDKLMEIEGIR
jgi:tetratricopeptide (TPR) repeat protein